jgi:hypothetical protein
MGDGGFGSNGSVHWNVNGQAPGSGVDRQKRHPGGGPNGRPVIGAPNHPGTFRVTLRYSDPGDAQAAMTALNNRFTPGATVIYLEVPVRPYQSAPGTPDTWEVTVDW